MTRSEKVEIIAKLEEGFKASEAIVVCNYRGLSTKKLEELRNNARENNVKVQIVKNTLANIALNNSGKTGLVLKDTNIYIWSNDQIMLSKIVCKFQEEHAEKFSVKFGYFDNDIVDSKHILAVSKLPTRDELIGMLLSIWNAPVRYFVTGLSNLKKQKEE